MQNTNIQWTDHTVNFWWGCTKVSRACKHCYAESVAKVFGKRLFGTVPQWGEWIDLGNMQPHMDRRAYKGHKFPDGTLMLRVGVDTAGELLNGVQHHAFPA